MPEHTSKYAVLRPVGGDPVQALLDAVRQHADALDANLILVGTDADMPLVDPQHPGIPGRLYLSLDSYNSPVLQSQRGPILWRDNGRYWDSIWSAGQQDIDTTVLPDTVDGVWQNARVVLRRDTDNNGMDDVAWHLLKRADLTWLVIGGTPLTASDVASITPAGTANGWVVANPNNNLFVPTPLAGRYEITHRADVTFPAGNPGDWADVTVAMGIGPTFLDSARGRVVRSTGAAGAGPYTVQGYAVVDVPAGVGGGLQLAYRGSLAGCSFSLRHLTARPISVHHD